MESPLHPGVAVGGGGTGSSDPVAGGGGGGDRPLESAEKIILRWDSTVSEEARERMIFDSDRQEVDRYLRAVDEIQRSMSSASINSDDEHHQSHQPAKANTTIQIAMARLEDEFRNILLTHSSNIETESLLLDTYGAASSSSLLSNSTRSDYSHHSAAAASGDDYTPRGDEDGDLLRGGGGSSSSSLDRSGGSRISISNYRSASSIREIELIPADAIIDLRSIAERMISAGYLRECVQVYGSVRKQSLDNAFKRLGVEKLSIGDVQRLDWEALEGKIRRWIWAAKVCVRTLFASEKRLSELIFDGAAGVEGTDDQCFLESVKAPAIQLFNFAEAISISRRSPEKLFKILDLHDALAELLPDVDAVFCSKPADSIRVQAEEIVSRLAEAARGILSEFENAVLRETSKVPVPGGTIHPLTRYVMNYVSLISDYKQTLLELIVSKPASRFSGDQSVMDMDLTESEEFEGKTPLALHLIWIIMILESNLEGKSQCYKDNSLAHFFIMNNVHYIVQKIKGSPELREMIGDYYLKKLTGKFRSAATNYQRATLVKVLHCLRDEGLHVTGSFSSGVSKSVLRDRFKAFNAMLEEVHRTQATWLIPDLQLREELRISISEKVIPAYRSFLGRFRSHIEGSRHAEQYIKYSVDDLETAVLDFFEGTPAPQHLRRRSQ